MLISKKNRNVVLSSDIDDITVKEIIEDIQEINAIDDKKEKNELKKRNPNLIRKPMNLIINSYGGQVNGCLAIIGAMELSKTPIHTITLGSAMSAAFVIAISGHKRFCHKFATFMCHEVSFGSFDRLQDTEERIVEMKRIQKILDEIIKNKTSITQEKLDIIYKTKIDRYYSAEESLENKMVDKIITSISDAEV